MVAINPDMKKPAKVWEFSKETPYVPCMLVKGDLLFWVTDKPGLGCCALKPRPAKCCGANGCSAKK